MKGTDCTPAQIESASQFLADRGWGTGQVKAINTREDIVRLIAWYGAVRFRSGAEGSGGTLDEPGYYAVVGS